MKEREAQEAMGQSFWISNECPKEKTALLVILSGKNKNACSHLASANAEPAMTFQISRLQHHHTPTNDPNDFPGPKEPEQNYH